MSARRAAVLITCGCVLVSAAGLVGANATAEPVSAAQLLARIDDARAAAFRGEIAPSSTAMDDVRAALALPVDVRLGGAVVSIASDPFLDTLAGATARDFRRAEEHLDALAASTQAAETAPAVSPARVDAALAAAYRGVPTPSIAERYAGMLLRLVANFIGRWIESLDASHGIGSVLAWAAVFLLLGAVVTLMRRLGVGFVPEATSHGSRRDVRVDWLREAERALAAGDAEAAVVAMYHALLEALAARGVITGDPAVTAGECRAAVARSLPDAYRAVASATESFERVAYGGVRAARGDVGAMRDANRVVRSA